MSNEAFVIRNALAGLSLDEIMKLGDMEIVERFLICWKCPKCESKRVAPVDAMAHREDLPGYRKLRASVGCWNCKQRWRVEIVVPMSIQAYEEIFATGKTLELAKQGKRAHYKPPLRHQMTGEIIRGPRVSDHGG